MNTDFPTWLISIVWLLYQSTEYQYHLNKLINNNIIIEKKNNNKIHIAKWKWNESGYHDSSIKFMHLRISNCFQWYFAIQ